MRAVREINGARTFSPERTPRRDAAMWLYALTTRLPMGQADRYSVLSAPTVAARLAALSEAVETVSALVEFQLSGE